MMVTMVVLVCVALIVFAWLSAMRARDVALCAAKAYCKEQQLSLMDEAVSLISMRITRVHGGKFGLCRRYRFEYGVDTRHHADIIVLGRQALSVEIEEKTSNIIMFPMNNRGK